ncbi:EP300-interacting inhibitor of differentiation 2 [Oryctolagus cuniculus]|uniref:EP300-interacting inhibitor of differentiation 2 n=1 Tax=Oryctolagus cuniculus TaxID=9986 RepID=UPI000491A3F0|nr:EP300-interacting inhibitor of differentiation 2 [Oryctolagus cuniculus]
MSELPAGGRVPQRRAAAGGDDAPPAEVSGGSLEPAVAQPAESASGAMAARRPEESPESRSRARFLREICMGAAAFSRHEREPEAFGAEWGRAQPPFGEEVPHAHGSRLRGLDEPSWVFMDACRAREVARDARWQTRYPNVYLDYFTFIEDLFASVALSRLAAELGCDRLKDRE